MHSRHNGISPSGLKSHFHVIRSLCYVFTALITTSNDLVLLIVAGTSRYVHKELINHGKIPSSYSSIWHVAVN